MNNAAVNVSVSLWLIFNSIIVIITFAKLYVGAAHISDKPRTSMVGLKVPKRGLSQLLFAHLSVDKMWEN